MKVLSWLAALMLVVGSLSLVGCSSDQPAKPTPAEKAIKDVGKKAEDAAKDVGKKAEDVAKDVGKKAEDVAKDVAKKVEDATKTAPK